MRKILIGTLILVGSLIILYQGLVPSLLWFMDTDLATKLFYVTAEADNKDRSMLAFEQCKAYAQQEFEEGSVIEFNSQDSKDLKIWKVINDTSSGLTLEYKILPAQRCLTSIFMCAS